MQQEVYDLLKKTYNSPSTEQIKQSTQRLLNFRSDKKLIPTLHSFLKHPEMSHPIKQAASNLVRIIAQRQLSDLQGIKSQFRGNRNYIPNQMYQIFKDVNTPHVYKVPVANAYVNMMLHDSGNSSHEKLIRDMNFYYTTGNAILAAILTQSLMKSKYLKSKQESDLYQSTLGKLIDSLSKFMNDFYSRYNPRGTINQALLNDLNFTFDIVHQTIVNLSFKKFPSAGRIIVSSNKMAEILEFLSNLHEVFDGEKHFILLKNEIIKKHQFYCRQILQKIIVHGTDREIAEGSSLNLSRIANLVGKIVIDLPQQIQRCKYSYFDDQLNRIVVLCLKCITFAIEKKLDTFREKTTTAIDNEMENGQYHKSVEIESFARSINLEWILENILFLITGKLSKQCEEIYEGSQNYDEFFNLLEDLFGNNQSECLEVQFNRLLLSISRNSFDEKDPLLRIYLNPSPKITTENVPSSSTKNRMLILLLPSLLLQNFIIDEKLQQNLESIILSYYRKYIIFVKDGEPESKPYCFFEVSILDVQNQEISMQERILFLLLVKNYSDEFFRSYKSEKMQFDIINQGFAINDLAEKSIFESSNTLSQQTGYILFVSNLVSKITESFFDCGGFKEDQKRKIEIFLKKFDENPLLGKILCLSKIVKNYNEDITGEFFLGIFCKAMKKMTDLYLTAASAENLHPLIRKTKIRMVLSSANMMLQKLFPEFFAVESYQPQFRDLLANIKDFIKTLSRSNMDINEPNQQKMRINFDNLFPILRKSIRVMKEIPEGYQDILWQCVPYLEDRQSVQAMNLVIVYAEQKSENHFLFIQKILKECLSCLNQIIHRNNEQQTSHDIHDYHQEKSFDRISEGLGQNKSLNLAELHSLLLIHIAIYYHHEKVSTEYIEGLIEMLENKFSSPKKAFDFVQGKYQLIFVILLRFQFKRVHQILVRRSQIPVCLSQKQPNNEKSNKNSYELLYDTVFYNENKYKIEYDSVVMITCQLDILKYYIVLNREESMMIFRYAHIALLEVIWAVQRIFDRKIDSDEWEAFSESDQSLLPSTDIEKELAEVKKSTEMLELPLEFRDNESQEIKIFNDFMRTLLSTPQGKKWYENNVNIYLEDSTKNKLEKMSEYRKVNGTYRKIYSVAKRMLNESNRPKNGHVQA